ncbi:disease resistance protein RPV1-like isoform X2 [Eucalyptus grandis]|uniref:disease resistance protein RPV1-like isoform X2 n=1 Tax=Eucalyptus grandis TaxID=71139 RepID=UPI00192ED1FF|nr:disease resistance protein RPV1-like isoform X2 [Eucalyptus grandis]
MAMEAEAMTVEAAVTGPEVATSSPLLSSTSTLSRTNYEVFLSFRGPDTRQGFADCLFRNLIHARIMVFKDDEELDPGENVPDALVQSIKQSKISIPILSQDYANSKSCLMELAQMVECQEEGGQLIVPIFYDVKPADLKYRRGRVGEAFFKHEKRGVDCKVIDIWKQALEKIADMEGYDLQNTDTGYGALTDKVVSDILELLKKNDLVVKNGLVGMEPHVREVMKKLGVIYVNEQVIGVHDQKDVRVLGIGGMPGIGKTTLAKVVYNKIHHLFQRCSSLSNVRENGTSDNLTMGLQKQLISHLRRKEYTNLRTLDRMTNFIKSAFSEMKVLILLDDVHHFDQIRHLVGDLSWFGPGSRILMTIGNIDVLDGYGDGVADKYEVGQMDTPQALELFRMRAFSGYTREEEDEYDDLARRIVKTIGGIPLAIEVTASYLHSKRGNIQIWEAILQRLHTRSADEVHEVIKVNYDSLKGDTRKIFLDIACFFIGMDARIPSYMWDACDYYSPIGIELLRNMSFVKIGENNELWMHNELRKFGREIVRRENENEPRKRSRLWNHIDALSTLKGAQSARKVEALGLTFDEGQSECFRREGFSHLQSLRFLRLDKATVGGILQDVLPNSWWPGYIPHWLRLDQATVGGSSHNVLPNSWWLGYIRHLLRLDQATVGGSSQDVLPNLRWLGWQGCSDISELLIFHLEKLVILDLSRSLVTGDPEVWEQILKTAKELKVLNLSGCCNLNGFLRFPASVDLQSLDLQRLVLEHCSVLSQIGPFIGRLISNQPP